MQWDVLRDREVDSNTGHKSDAPLWKHNQSCHQSFYVLFFGGGGGTHTKKHKIKVVARQFVMRANVKAPVKQKKLRSTQDDWQPLILFISIAKNIQVVFFTNSHFKPMLFPFLSYVPSLTLLICYSLSPSLSPSLLTPYSVLNCRQCRSILWLLYEMVSLNKFDWTNMVISFGDCSQ